MQEVRKARKPYGRPVLVRGPKLSDVAAATSGDGGGEGGE